MVFACDVKSDVVVASGVIVGSVVDCNFFAVFEFGICVIVFNVFWDMAEDESTVGNKF